MRVKHPGIIIGHKDCKNEPKEVPKNMGWLWNVENPGVTQIRRGWRPGAVRKSVAKLMQHFLKKETPPPAEPNILPQKSALKVERKFGEYTITMNDFSEGDFRHPIVFKVTKSDEAKKRSEARSVLKTRGITKKCECNSFEECKCMSGMEKIILKCQLKKVSQEFCLCPEMTLEDWDESSDSEMNFEFSPPLAMKCKSKKCVKTANDSTQYEAPISEKAANKSDENALLKSKNAEKERNNGKDCATVKDGKCKLKSEKSKCNEKSKTLNEKQKCAQKCSKNTIKAKNTEAQKNEVLTLRPIPSKTNDANCQIKCCRPKLNPCQKFNPCVRIPVPVCEMKRVCCPNYHHQMHY